uniref:LIM zinc-binding domain-containing protein n=1 Tax=Salix viminalis TaxID=40686 RepID=A0A6N2KB39_SALVM
MGEEDQEKAESKAVSMPTPPVEEEKEASLNDAANEKSLVPVSEKVADPTAAENVTGGSNNRDAILSRVETEKRYALIKAWVENEKAKVENKAHKKLSAIGSWETTKKVSVEAKIRKFEDKMERKKAEYAEKMKNKAAELHKAAEEKKAMIEAKKSEECLKNLLLNFPVKAFLSIPSDIRFYTARFRFTRTNIMGFTGTLEKCKACDKTVYFIELVSADGVPYHKKCFKCSHCNGLLVVRVLFIYPFLFFPRAFSFAAAVFVTVEGEFFHKTCFRCSHGGCFITPSSYAALDGILYCKAHFSQLFKQKGSYSYLTKTSTMKKNAVNLPEEKSEAEQSNSTEPAEANSALAIANETL